MLMTWEGRAFLNAHIFYHHQAQVLPGHEWLFQVNPSRSELSPGKRKEQGHHMGPRDAGAMTAQRRQSQPGAAFFCLIDTGRSRLELPKGERARLSPTLHQWIPRSTECRDIHNLWWLLAQHIRALHFLFKTKANSSQTKANLCSTLGSMLIHCPFFSTPY